MKAFIKELLIGVVISVVVGTVAGLAITSWALRSVDIVLDMACDSVEDGSAVVE